MFEGDGSQGMKRFYCGSAGFDLEGALIQVRCPRHYWLKCVSLIGGRIEIHTDGDPLAGCTWSGVRVVDSRDALGIAWPISTRSDTTARA